MRAWFCKIVGGFCLLLFRFYPSKRETEILRWPCEYRGFVRCSDDVQVIQQKRQLPVSAEDGKAKVNNAHSPKLPQSLPCMKLHYGHPDCAATHKISNLMARPNPMDCTDPSTTSLA